MADIREFGAVGDGITLNTAAVQKAIDVCAQAGGGRVTIDGGKYLCGTICLKSNVELYIGASGVLLASPRCEDFPERNNLRHVDSAMLPRERNACFIFAEECENIAIGGQGMIDCNGSKFVVRREGDVRGWLYERIDAPTPPRVVFFTGCRNVQIRDVTMINQPAGWSYWIHDCDYVHITGLNIAADVNYPNNDGIHINCSRNVTVSDCNISCGDDCIIVRANSVSLKENKVCEKVCVVNCNLTSYSGGIRIGWVNDGTIRDCTFSNIVMTDTSVGISLSLPDLSRPQFADVGREATLAENLSFSHIVMHGICSNSIKIDISDSPNVLVNAVRNIYFSGIHASGAEFPLLRGREGTPLKNISFDNCDFEITDGSEFPNRQTHGGCTWQDGVRHAPVLSYIDGLKMNNVTWTIR